MKKIATVALSLLFVVSVVFGANSDLTVKRVQKSRMLKSAFSTIGQEQKVSLEEKAIPVLNKRVRIGKMQPGKMHLRKTDNETIQLHNWVMPKKTFKSEKSKFSSGISKAAQDEGIDTLVIDFIENDTVQYVPGGILVLQVISTDSVLIEPYVDNGDGIFDLTTDLLITGPDMEEEIWVIDGGEDDETSAGDGIFQITLNTGDLEGGAWFGIQGGTIFISATEKTSQNQGLGVCYIDRPDENTSISGTVMIEGEPMLPAANMVVVAFQKNEFGDGNDGPPDVGFLTMTDDTGYYLIEIPDAMRGEFVVFVFDFWNFYPGYFPDPDMMSLPVMGEIPDVNFVLREATETIYGYVMDENNNPVPDIRVYAENGPHYVEDTTDASGYYVLPVFPGWWRVELEEDDLIGDYMIPPEQHLEVFEDGDHPADFTLYTTNGNIQGNVSYQDGTPVQGIEVEAGIWLGEEEGGYWTYSETDEYGDYNLMVSTSLQGRQICDDDWDTTNCWNSSYWVSIWTEDGIVVPREYWDIFADTTGLDFTIYMSDAMLSGYIFDSATGDPLWNAGIHAYIKDSTFVPLPQDPYSMDVWDWTDGDGYYELPLIGGTPPDGKLWNIEVFWPGEWIPSVVDTLNVFSGNNYTQDYYIEPPVTQGLVEGYVYDKDGIGINNARVELYGPEYYETWTDGSGYFILENVEFGWYSATAYAPDYEPNTIYDILVGPEPVWLEFWMGSSQGDIHVSGYVTDAVTTEPILGSLVLAFNWEFGEPFSFFTDSSGYYEFFLKPGLYDFQAGANGYFVEYNYSIDIYQDTTLNFSLNSAVDAITDTLRGRVVDDIGNPLKRVFIYFESDTSTYMSYTFTDFNGNYEIGLVPGYYRAMFSKKGFNTEERWFNFPSESPEDPLTMYPETWVTGPQLIDVMDVPMDQGKQVRLKWKRAEGLQGAVKCYQIWRAIRPMNGPEPPSEFETGWDYIATVPIHPDFDIYNYVAPTLYDKIGDNIYWTGFIVTAIGWDNWSYWDSNIKAGWSEDNLSPETPTNLTGSFSEGAVALTWEAVINEPVKYYSIYRRLENEQLALIGYSAEPEFSDTELPGSDVYYAVSATDYGLNESPKSSETKVTITAVENVVEIPDEFALKPNYPNPFNPETTIEFALPKESKVTLTVYNLKGQFIRELARSEYNAGYQRVVWDARDQYGNAVGSGVYIYTIKADNFSQTRKMILLR
ncbi:MAG: hypothetical protein DRP89_04510 [Candidatus Neomarinimicrobiota bacterium]|nr:MAG: hypothetical protein DRP89_04510 [Candidatus Neomarinimicrobiota bacterium]